jgi:hypothetical protein
VKPVRYYTLNLFLIPIRPKRAGAKSIRAGGMGTADTAALVLLNEGFLERSTDTPPVKVSNAMA